MTANESDKKLVEIKIIEEPIGFNAQSNNLMRLTNDFTDESTNLKPKFRPAKFTGPSHLRKLIGKCFEKVSNKYFFINSFKSVEKRFSI